MDGENYTDIGQNYDKVVAGIRIDWDVPLEMDDGVVLRCDVFSSRRMTGNTRS